VISCLLAGHNHMKVPHLLPSDNHDSNLRVSIVRRTTGAADILESSWFGLGLVNECCNTESPLLSVMERAAITTPAQSTSGFSFIAARAS
jgi:hypothetical protein